MNYPVAATSTQHEPQTWRRRGLCRGEEGYKDTRSTESTNPKLSLATNREFQNLVRNWVDFLNGNPIDEDRDWLRPIQKNFDDELARKLGLDPREFADLEDEQRYVLVSDISAKMQLNALKKARKKLSPTQLDAVNTANGTGKCTLTGLKFGPGLSRLAPVVDHCHRTGKVRGVICKMINQRMIGLVQEEPKFWLGPLQRAWNSINSEDSNILRKLDNELINGISQETGITPMFLGYYEDESAEATGILQSNYFPNHDHLIPVAAEFLQKIRRGAAEEREGFNDQYEQVDGLGHRRCSAESERIRERGGIFSARLRQQLL